ncbi:MAG: zf-HC2 domain-containing protein [Myxococcales bacterium]|nr:zf-HC2 domain-containing protein [Myxococcales bacterium]
MMCPDDNRLVEFVAGLLPPDASRALDDHVDGCPRCRELLALYAPAPTAAADEPAGGCARPRSTSPRRDPPDRRGCPSATCCSTWSAPARWRWCTPRTIASSIARSR